MTDKRGGFEIERLRYQWYTGYEKEDEYERNPDWAADMCETEEEVEEDEDFTRPQMKFYDRYEPQHMWIKSDTVYDLTNMT
jgi:hypothetical protein